MFAMKQPRKLSNELNESKRFDNFHIQAPKSKGGLWFTVQLKIEQAIQIV